MFDFDDLVLEIIFSEFSQSKILWNSRYCGSLLPVFGVRVSVTFHLTYVHIILNRFGLLSGHLFGNSCSLG